MQHWTKSFMNVRDDHLILVWKFYVSPFPYICELQSTHYLKYLQDPFHILCADLTSTR